MIIFITSGLTINLTQDLRLFYSKVANAVCPKLRVKSIRCLANYVILADQFISRIEARLAHSNLQIPFMETVCKTFACDLGR